MPLKPRLSHLNTKASVNRIKCHSSGEDAPKDPGRTHIPCKGAWRWARTRRRGAQHCFEQQRPDSWRHLGLGQPVTPDLRPLISSCEHLARWDFPRVTSEAPLPVTASSAAMLSVPPPADAAAKSPRRECTGRMGWADQRGKTFGTTTSGQPPPPTEKTSCRCRCRRRRRRCSKSADTSLNCRDFRCNCRKNEGEGNSSFPYRPGLDGRRKREPRHHGDRTEASAQLRTRSARQPSLLREVWSRLFSRLDYPCWEDQNGRKMKWKVLGVPCDQDVARFLFCARDSWHLESVRSGIWLVSL